LEYKSAKDDPDDLKRVRDPVTTFMGARASDAARSYLLGLFAVLCLAEDADSSFEKTYYEK